MSDETDIIARLADLFARRGAEAYLGEPVTMAAHMLQAATLARADGAPDALVAAALLHDVGHFWSAAGEYTPDDDFDRRHQEAGAAALAADFPPAVTEPVRLHVAAKRYLCATDTAYWAGLSDASRHTLSLQGGPMDADEVAAFEALPFHAEAVRVRRWDDLGKAPQMRTPGFDAFRAVLARVRRA